MKKSKPKSELPTATYVERAAAMKREAVTAEIKIITNLFKDFDGEANKVEQATINAVNTGRQIGLHLQAMTGHKQIDLDFWKARCEGQLPFNFDKAKQFVSFANKMPRPAETIQEAIQFVQGILIADDLLQLPARTGAQNATMASPFQKFVGYLTAIRAPFSKIISSVPMEKWESQELDDFLSETEWVQVERDRALKIKTSEEKN